MIYKLLRELRLYYYLKKDFKRFEEKIKKIKKDI